MKAKFADYAHYFRVFLRRYNPKNYKVTSSFILANGITFYIGTNYSELEKYFYYDPWDRFRTLFNDDEENSVLLYPLDVFKRGVTLLYPKTSQEAMISTACIFFFGRPIELLLGGRLLLLTYACSLAMFYLCTIPSSSNTIRTDESINAYIYCFSCSIPFIFCWSTIFRVYKVLHWASWVPILWHIFQKGAEYENRPQFLTALLIGLFTKFKYKCI